MTFAPQIRKDMIKALEDSIIPAVQDAAFIQLLAEPAYDFSAIETRTIRAEPLPDIDLAAMQFIGRWQAEKMLISRVPIFCIIYEGVNYEKVGMTASMTEAARKRGEAPADGITLLRMPSPCSICIPGNIPHGDGSPRHDASPGMTRFFSLLAGDSDVKAYIGERSPGYQFGSHHLEISDPLILQMMHIYLDELRQRDGCRAAQAQLLAIMLRLKRYLETHRPALSNSSWPTPAIPSALGELETRNGELCRDIISYIQTHLHQTITLDLLSQRFGISSTHMNRVFQSTVGTTVMRHVTSMRIEAAKEILMYNSERVRDVAQLVGFASNASFSTVFRRQTGMSPREFSTQPAFPRNRGNITKRT